MLNVDDVIETANHFRCIDMIIDNAKAALTEKLIKELHLILKNGTSDSRKEWFAVGDYKKRDLFYQEFMKIMNAIKKRIDPESDIDYAGMFTKKGSVVSGSEETVFYVSRLLAAVEMISHECPIIMDSFRAEDLSTDKEARVLKEMLRLHNQCILTTTLKEENGKYNTFDGIHVLDYTNHRTNKILGQEHLDDFRNY